MAAEKRKPPKNQRAEKGIRSKWPTKRSINLILIDENKISPIKAALGIIVIVALAAVFSKFMVVDRLNEMFTAQTKAEAARRRVMEAEAMLENYDEIQNNYAHYTYDDMTASEMNLVNRVSILELVGTILPAGETNLVPEEFEKRVVELIRARCDGEESVADMPVFLTQLYELFRRVVPTGYIVNSWSASDNILSVSIRGTSLERLNRLARKMELEDIVNSVAITTANKRDTRITDDAVQAQFIVYLQKAVAKEASTE